MKRIVIPVFLMSILFTSAIFASCGSGYWFGNCSSGFFSSGNCGTTYGSCGGGAVAAETGCGPRCIYDTTCQCTDPGRFYNDCIDRCTYCEAFGNIGAR